MKISLKRFLILFVSTEKFLLCTDVVSHEDLLRVIGVRKFVFFQEKELA